MRNTLVRKFVYLVLICMLSFTGCSLAVEDAGEENVVSQDRLIGAFITTEHLDLFDMDAYLNDHADELISGEGSNEVDVDGRDYNERLYAMVDKKNSSSPVYQTADGEIYTVTGNGYSMSGELGGSSTVNLEEETTITENGVTKNYGGAVEITFEVLKYAPVNIRIQFMNEDLEIVDTKEYAAGEMPEQLELAEDAVCIVVETQWADGSVSRE